MRKVITGDNIVITGDNNRIAEMVRRVTQVDDSTGEVLGSFVAVIQPKRRNGFGRGWFAMAQEALRLLRTAGLGARDYDVLFALLERLDFDNLIQVSQADLAADCGMQRSNVNRSIRRLIELGCLLEGPKIGRSRSFRLNPRFGWRGSAKSHQDALRARMEASGLSVVPGRDPDTIDAFTGRPDRDGD